MLKPFCINHFCNEVVIKYDLRDLNSKDRDKIVYFTTVLLYCYISAISLYIWHFLLGRIKVMCTRSLHYIMTS